jgi:DNA-binding transcriptional regulator YiaG
MKTSHSLNCVACGKKQSYEVVRKLQEYHNKSKFKYVCVNCGEKMNVWVTVLGYFSFMKADKPRWQTIKKCEVKPYVRDKTKNHEMSVDLLKKRYQLNLTQKQMGLLFGVSQATYNNWESGAIKPRAVKLQEVIKFLES